MRFARTYALAFFSLHLAFPVFAQQPSASTTQSSPQALALLEKSLAVLTGGQPIADVISRTSPEPLAAKRTAVVAIAKSTSSRSFEDTRSSHQLHECVRTRSTRWQVQIVF